MPQVYRNAKSHAQHTEVAIMNPSDESSSLAPYR